MDVKAKVKEGMVSLNEFLNGQTWFQQLKAKWEELDQQSRYYLKFALVGSGILMVLLFILSSIWGVHSLKSELIEKRKLLSLIQSANEEIRRLKESMPGTGGLQQGLGGGGGRSAGDTGGPWSSYFETVGSSLGIEKASLTVSPEKPGSTSDQSKELLYDINLKHVSIKQVVRYAFSLENGQRPIKLRNLLIDTQADPAGYMDATLAISAFTLVVTQ